MIDIKEIISAYSIRINPTEQQKQLAEERLKVCSVCEYLTTMPINRCTKCGCPTGAKSFSPKNSCPMKKWTN